MLESAEIFRRNGIELLDEFLTNGPFGADISAKDALAYLGNVRAHLNALRKREAQLRKDLGVFDLSLPESLEIQRLERVRYRMRPLQIVYVQFCRNWQHWS